MSIKIKSSSYIDDTVQLEHMTSNQLEIVDMDEDNLANYGPTHDRVMIIPGDDPHTQMDTSTHSMDPSIAESNVELVGPRSVVKNKKLRNLLSVFVLTFVNLLNYMDRYTVAGVLMDVQDYYQIDNAKAGLLQTSFIVFYMLMSPIFGFLGDRFNRKLLMAVGIFFWSCVTLAGSFVPSNMFPLFLFMRALVGVGEASYSTIAPTIIADLFVKDQRSKALSIFYFAIPVGSGLGYIVGSKVAAALGAWQWSLRVTPGLGILCVILILFIVKEPPRGQAEGGTHLHSTSWCADLAYLVTNKSFILSSAGFTCVAFIAGALALWAPTYIEYSIRVQGHNQDPSTTSLYFGIITCVAGFLGVGIGSESARRIRKHNPRADPLVCAFGLLSCSPFLFAVIYISKFNTTATWVLIFIGETLLCLNWAIVTDMLLYIVIPTRRSTAEAVQILMSHALGDAGSPYLLGAVSDSIKTMDSTWQNYLSLQYSLYMCCFVAVLGGGFFLATALFIEEDRAKADRVIKGAVLSQAREADMRDREDGDEGPDDDFEPEVEPKGVMK